MVFFFFFCRRFSITGYRVFRGKRVYVSDFEVVREINVGFREVVILFLF